MSFRARVLLHSEDCSAHHSASPKCVSNLVHLKHAFHLRRGTWSRISHTLHLLREYTSPPSCVYFSKKFMCSGSRMPPPGFILFPVGFSWILEPMEKERKTTATYSKTWKTHCPPLSSRKSFQKCMRRGGKRWVTPGDVRNRIYNRYNLDAT